METEDQEWFNEISDLFGRRITQVDIFGVSVSFTPSEQDVKELVRNFPEALFNVVRKIIRVPRSDLLKTVNVGSFGSYTVKVGFMK